ncbi:ankyrin repeat domain-containing protein [Leptospira sp. GIMC2001]|uniref:ankyrin repeat domain-containing protein n=1 Tax=Leptospira sp. GIMC2001 TaxID=1513297 RepID=UPI00234BA07B|nr:ankyrin repeat domain-containing protein [Leptospira sp. GIMC2001]WCL50192.1 ankyrin repeat domain-containing protein [Leptospira sp. GIMC2001]
MFFDQWKRFYKYPIILAVAFYGIGSFTLSAEEASDVGEVLDPGCGLPIFNDTKLIKQRAVWISNVRWATGSKIPVYFMNGTAEQKASTEHCAREWERYGNFSFDFKQGVKRSNELAINIKFGPQKQGVLGWSYLGTGMTDPNRSSMEYDTPYKGANACSTIVHEFGHALGLHHEQYNPSNKSTWIPEKVYDYFGNKMGWSRNTIDTDILQLRADKYSNYTKADPVSVMAYYFPGELFKSGKPMGRRFGLSQGDIEGIMKMFPGKPRPSDTKPIHLYFKNSGIAIRSTAKNGKMTIFVNGQAVETIDSTGGRNSQKVINLDDKISKSRLDVISFSFQSNNRDFAYWLNIEEGSESLFGLHCDPNTHCDGFKQGFYLTHVSNGNRGQHSNLGQQNVATTTTTNPSSTTTTNPTSTTSTTTTTTTTTTTNNTEPLNPELNSNLIYHCYEGNTNEVRSLLNRGADPNAKYEGWTPLLYASYMGHEQVVLELLRKNADFSETYQGWNARMFAVEKGHKKIVEMIDAAMGFHPDQQKTNRSLPSLPGK